MAGTVHWKDSQAELLSIWTADAPKLLGLDFDGTLSHYVDRPEDAKLAENLPEILETLAERSDTTVAVISGRALTDVRSRVGITAAVYAGNHGFEIAGRNENHVQPVDQGFRSSLDRLIERASHHLSDCAGVWWEDKQHTATFHFRLALPEHHARIADVISELAAQEPELGLHHGVMIWEFRPRRNWHKGRAFGWLLESSGVSPAHSFYIGDDETDEHVFREWPQAASIVVGTDRPTSARFHVNDVYDARALLDWLAGQ